MARPKKIKTEKEKTSTKKSVIVPILERIATALETSNEIAQRRNEILELDQESEDSDEDDSDDEETDEEEEAGDDVFD